MLVGLTRFNGSLLNLCSHSWTLQEHPGGVSFSENSPSVWILFIIFVLNSVEFVIVLKISGVKHSIFKKFIIWLVEIILSVFILITLETIILVISVLLKICIEISLLFYRILCQNSVLFSTIILYPTFCFQMRTFNDFRLQFLVECSLAFLFLLFIFYFINHKI
jgi:hypothetical protein